ERLQIVGRRFVLRVGRSAAGIVRRDGRGHADERGEEQERERTAHRGEVTGASFRPGTQARAPSVSSPRQIGDCGPVRPPGPVQSPAPNAGGRGPEGWTMRFTTSSLALVVAGAALFVTGVRAADTIDGPHGSIVFAAGDRVHGYLRAGETHLLDVHLAKGDVYRFSVAADRPRDRLLMQLTL